MKPMSWAMKAIEQEVTLCGEEMIAAQRQEALMSLAVSIREEMDLARRFVRSPA